MEQAFVSWSGGKDCCLACYRAITSGMQVRYLLNMLTEDGKQSRSHGLQAKWLKMQAGAIGIPIIQQPASRADYEAEFKSAILGLKEDGVNAGIFGDIDFNPHREWIDRVCFESGVTPILPLWLEDQNKILREFMDSGFEAVVVATRADMLGEEWLGRKINADFAADLRELGNITPCGEAGEYHTLVLGGPLFRKKLKITEGNRVLRKGHWFLEIVKCEIESKKATD